MNSKFLYTNFLDLKDKILLEGNLVLLCNQTSYSFEQNKYFFEILAEKRNLKQILIPEHGLFAELQDQVPLNSTKIYDFINSDVQIISLYGNTDESITIKPELLKNIDAIIIDILDIGSRYYTYISTIANIFKVIAENNISIKIYVIERPNPAGTKVEGTIIIKEYSSFIGHYGLPHRHGLSIGEMCLFLKNQINGKFNLTIVKNTTTDNVFVPFIQPSPNIPTLETINIYTGQCLFEGTNISEGRGTTKPFEIIGAPYFKWKTLQKIQKQINEIYPNNENIYLRILKFIPKFHKFANQVCTGFQIHQKNTNFHSLSYSLILIRLLKENFTEYDFWRKGKYEKGNNKTAIELLAGDKTILDYLNGKLNFNIVAEKMKEHENKWKKKNKELSHSLVPFRRKMYE